MRFQRANQLEAGTTLAEVSIAIAILAVMAGGIIGAFNYGFFSMQMTRENQRATQILLEKVETIRLYTWDQVNSNGFIPVAFQDLYDPRAASAQRGITYHGTLTITNPPFSTSYSSNIRQLSISLVWTNGAGTMVRSRSMATLIAEDGIQNYVY